MNMRMSSEGKLLRVKRLDLAYHRVGFSVAASLLVSALLVAGLWPLVAGQSLLAWLFALWSILAVRYIFTRRFLKRCHNTDIELGKWTTGYVIGAAATGLCWGLTVFIFAGSASDQTTILLVFVIAGVSAFASVAMATIPFASNVFMLSSLLPMAMWLLAPGGYLHSIMALITLVYLGLMLLLSRHVHRTVLSSLISTEQNKELTSAVQERDGRMQHYFESAPGCYFTLQLDADRGFFMPFASFGIMQLFGLDPDEVAESIKPLLQRIRPDDSERLLQELHQSAKRMTPCKSEFRIAAPAKGEQWIALQCMPKEADGSTIQWHGFMQDITAGKLLEEQARMKEHALDHSSESVFLIDEEARFIYVNEQVCHSLGYTRAELLTMSTPDIDPDYSLERAKAVQPMAIASGVLTFETRHRRCDGSVFPVEIQLSVLEYAGRALTIAMVRNITERKRLENELAQRETAFRTLADNLPDPVFRYDRDCRRIYVNQAAMQVTRSSLAQLLGNLPSDCATVDPECAANTMASIREVFATGERRTLYVKYLNEDGSTHDYQGLLVPEFDADGQVTSVLTMAHEVTSWREAEQRTERYFTNMPGFAYTLRCEPDGRMSMPFVSRGIEDIYGLFPEDLREDATPMHAVEHPDDRLRIDTTGAQARQTLQPFLVEYRVQRPGHPLRWIESRSLPEEQADGSILWHGVMLDVTERKRMEVDLADSRNFLNTVINSISDPIAVKDREHRWILLNDSCCAMVGHPREALIGKSDYDFLPKEQADVFWEKDELVFRTGEVNINEEFLTSFNGTTRHLLTQKSPFVFSDGQRYSVATSRDITDRKRMEDSLQEREARYRDKSNLLNSVLESASDVIVFALDHNYRYIAYNSTHKNVMQAIWGKEISLGMSMLEVIGSHDDAKVAKQGYDRALAGESFVQEEAYGDEALSRQYWQNHWAPIRSDAGEVIGLTCFVINITERKQSQQKLELLDRAIDMSGDAVFMMDAQLRFTFANETACRALGYSREELLAMGPCDIDPDMPREALLKIMHESPLGIAATIETRHRAKDGRIYPVEISGVKFEDGGKRFSLTVARDITVRKQTELVIAEAKNRLQTILKTFPDLIWLKNAEGVYQTCNPSFECFFGAAEADIVGKTDYDFVDTELADFFRAKDKKAIDSGEVSINEEWVTFAQDGHRALLETRKVPLLDASGQVVGVLGIGHDITERKLAEDALRERKAFVDSLLNAIPIPVFYKNSEGRYLGFNAAYETFFGVSPDQLIGKSVFDTHPKELADIYHAKDVEVFEMRGKMQQYESPLKHANGTLREVFFSKAAFLDSHGNVKGLIGAILDITERKHAETALQENLEQISALNRNLEENAWILEDQASELEASQGQLMRALEFTEGVINAIPDILFEMDRNGRYLNVWTQNPQVLAAQKTALLGKSVFEILDPESAAASMESIREADLQGVSYGNTIAIVRSNGETRWYEHSLAKKQSNELSQPTFIVLSRDITERKRMEDELRLREREFRSLVDSLPDPFFRYDRECRRTYVNAQVERLTGQSAASLLGLTVAESRLASPHWSAILERDIQQVLATGQPLDEELEYQAPDGRTIHYANRLGPVIDDNGEVSSVMLLMHDVTDIKASELKLKEALAFSEGIINAIPDLLFEVDRDGRYLNIWTQKPELLVTSKPEMLESSIHEDLSQENAVALMKAISEAEERGMSTGVPICIDLPQGPHWFEHTISKKPGGAGADARFLMLSRDVTDRMQAEQALQANFEQITALNRHLENSARDLEEQAARLEVSQEQLQLTEAWYRSILQSAPDGMLVVNDRGIITLVNTKLVQMFGYAEGELIGQSIELLVPPGARGGHVAKRNGFIGGNSRVQRMAGEAANLRGLRQDGSEFAVDIALSRLPDMDGCAGVICAAIRDVTEQQRLEKALAARELESRTLVENTPDSISRHDRNGAYIFVNQALVDSFKGGMITVLGKKPTEVRPTGQSATYEEKLHQVFTTGTNTEFELTWLDKSGNNMCYHIRLTAEFDASGAVATVLAVGRDITELHLSRQKIHQMAFYDALTSLPNRALFGDRLRQMLTDAQWHEQQAGVMLLDLDRFKAINDSMGHPAGDVLLREAAVRLTGCVRGYDTVARLGGDEFAILLPDIRAGDDLGRIASKILAAFNEPFMLEGKEVFASTSIGIAVYPDDSLDADELVKQADSAMYFVKRSGRNGFRFYSKDLTASSGERLALESELRRAVERKELELYYQPKIRLADKQLIGSEALLRWNNPQRGLVPPDQFISIAEDSGLIIDIGEWVLLNACRTACDWNGADKPLHKVAINLSARQFQSNDLVKTVRDVLETTGCRTEWIELEITESLLLDEQGEVLETLNTFSAMGISIAIDDFGTGYSSLSYLARFPINTLKIDRSFIRTVTTEHYRAELVKAILSIARCLGQEVVAEGVETTEQAAFLQAHGCQIAQGYLFGKPVPKAAASRWREFV